MSKIAEMLDPLDSNKAICFDSSEASIFDTPSAIADLAEMLTQLEDSEGLAELQLVPEFTRARLNRALAFVALRMAAKAKAVG